MILRKVYVDANTEIKKKVENENYRKYLENRSEKRGWRRLKKECNKLIE